MRKKHIPKLTASALGFIAVCIFVIVAWDIFTEARSKTPVTKEQLSAAELSAAIEAQRQVAAKLTRSASFDQRLQKLIEKARKKGTVSVIVRVRAAFRPEGQISSAAETLAQRKVIEEAQDQMLSWLRYVPSTLKRYEYLPYIAASVDAAGLEQLQSSSGALDISENKPLRLALSESLHRVGAPRAWAGSFNGTGKIIAVIDSGVDKNHPWLAGKVVSEACYSTTDPARLYSSVCPSGIAPTDPGSGVPCGVPGFGGVDNCGHGTHIAGIAAGRGGVAYAANIISIQVMSRVDDSETCRGQASCLLSDRADVVSALLRVYDLRNTYDIAAVNISLAGDPLAVEPFPNPCDTEYQAMTDAINLLRSVNIATVIASGNDGATDAISFPACISSAVSVGATGDGSGANAPVDTVLQFSNSASFLNLLAPGSLITSSVPGVGVEGGFGTSQAAAHVSGAWALLKEKYPDATVDQVLNKLTSFGVNITDPRNGVGIPRIQIDAALEVTMPPETWIGEYYNNINLEGAPALVRDDGGGSVDRYYNGQSPAPGFVGAEHYSIRWTRKLTLTAGTYRFSLTSDDGARLYIDGDKKIDQWPNSPSATTNVNVDLTSGVHDIRLEYYQYTSSALARLIWGMLDPDCSQTATADHWKGEYFNNANLAGSPVMTRDDGNSDSLNFNWGVGPSISDCNLTIFPDYFSVRWTRTVNLRSATYRFTVFGDNGVRLWVDDQKIIDRWTDTVGTNTANVQLLAGNHIIRLEYFETSGGAAVSLSWASSPDPPSNLMASAASDSQINLHWADNSSFEGGFKIERWNGGGYSQINTVGANATTYTDSGLTLLTTYSYRVRAFNGVGDSGYSNESSATTFLPPPSNLVANTASNSQINLSWSDNSNFEDGFKIERWNGSGYSQINTVGANVKQYTDYGLTPSTTYYYRTRAFSSAGDSGYSNESGATTFACSYGTAASNSSYGGYGGQLTITVSTAAGCSWSATSNVSWIWIDSGASGTGNGSVNYTISYFGQYLGYRSGTVTVAGQTHTIEQWGDICPFTEPDACPFALPVITPDKLTTNAEPGGLTARYFSNMKLSGQPALERTDPAVSFNWAGNRPDAALPADHFSARWSGQLAAPSSEGYTFYLYSDGGARLWVNNQLVIDHWQPSSKPQTRSAPVELKTGAKVDVRVEYYNAGRKAAILLLWSSASTPKQVIPQRYLHPEAARNESTPTDTNKQTGQQTGQPTPGSDAGPKVTRP